MLVYNKKSDGINKKVKDVLNKEKTLTNIWEYAVGLGGTTNNKEAFKQLAIFPEKLVRDHVLSWSNEGDLVFAPFAEAEQHVRVPKYWVETIWEWKFPKNIRNCQKTELPK